MAQFGTNIEEDLPLLDAKIKQLKNEYDQYFLGSRKRAPSLLRGEVQKMVTFYANIPIQNTGYRFKFNNLRARYFSFRRHWDDVLRKIEEGTYERQLFKAKLRETEAKAPAAREAPPPEEHTHALRDPALFEAYVAARSACGQDVAALTPARLQALLAKQEAAIRAQYGCDNVRFRVVVQDGQARLKATRGS